LQLTCAAWPGVSSRARFCSASKHSTARCSWSVQKQPLVGCDTPSLTQHALQRCSHCSEHQPDKFLLNLPSATGEPPHTCALGCKVGTLCSCSRVGSTQRAIDVASCCIGPPGANIAAGWPPCNAALSAGCGQAAGSRSSRQQTGGGDQHFGPPAHPHFQTTLCEPHTISGPDSSAGGLSQGTKARDSSSSQVC
jgi:hypothetical protein